MNRTVSQAKQRSCRVELLSWRKRLKSATRERRLKNCMHCGNQRAWRILVLIPCTWIQSQIVESITLDTSGGSVQTILGRMRAPTASIATVEPKCSMCKKANWSWSSMVSGTRPFQVKSVACWGYTWNTRGCPMGSKCDPGGVGWIEFDLRYSGRVSANAIAEHQHVIFQVWMRRSCLKREWADTRLQSGWLTMTNPKRSKKACFADSLLRRSPISNYSTVKYIN